MLLCQLHTRTLICVRLGYFKVTAWFPMGRLVFAQHRNQMQQLGYQTLRHQHLWLWCLGSHWEDNMINFSPAKQAFYDTTLIYPDLPSDLIEITIEQHEQILSAINSGCIVFPDLSYSPPRPTQFHEWDGKAWLDKRTEEEIKQHQRQSMPNLSPIEFDIKLIDAGLYDQVQELIQSDIKLKIAYTRATFFSRTAPFIDQARIALNLTDEQVDEMWTS